MKPSKLKRGRPRLHPGQGRTVSFTVRMTPAEHAALMRNAREARCAVGEMARRAMKVWGIV